MLETADIVARIATAALIGSVIGLNRHLHHKYVGLRTLSLIGASAAAVVLVTLQGLEPGMHIESMSRVVQGLLTGIGFIGAGVIVRGPTEKKVHGLTTAASVLTTAILGILCGVGAWRIAFVLVVVTVLVLLFGGPIEKRIHSFMDRFQQDPSEDPDNMPPK